MVLSTGKEGGKQGQSRSENLVENGDERSSIIRCKYAGRCAEELPRAEASGYNMCLFKHADMHLNQPHNRAEMAYVHL